MSRDQPRQLAEVLLTIAGIWLVARRVPDYATSLYLVWSSPSAAQASGGPNMLVPQSVHILVSVLLGLTLILARQWLARWLTPTISSVSNSAPSEAISATGALTETLLAVGVALLGTQHLADGIINLGSHYLALSKTASADPGVLWHGGLSVVIGIGLFAGSVGLGRLWARLRGRLPLNER